ncbi:MAG: DUF4007 family protein [Bryobacterales bacterium]|nr:DUF4007 family protein [Bryobacterales bacterium]
MIDYSVAAAPNSASFRFSGHETFAFRHAWLPKAYRLLQQDSRAFTNVDRAMIELGLGKNMVRALRFWVEAAGVARPDGKRGLELTNFANDVLDPNGQDPYLEDVRTLWLLHWNLSARSESALFAWRYLLSHWAFPELTRTEALAAFARESVRLGHSHSAITLSQHLDAFLHTYLPSRSRRVGIEDSLDGPLVDLTLLEPVGERRADGGRRETIFAFRYEPKTEITPALFDYCLDHFWRGFRAGDETLTLREVTFGPCSPGQVFKLPEDAVRSRVEAYAAPGADRPFLYQPSAVQGLISRRGGAKPVTFADIYEAETVDA